jgi:MFS family permease
MSAHQKVQKQQEIKEIENVDRRLTNRYFIPFFVTQFCGALNDNLFKNATVVLFTFYLTQFQTSATSIELSQIATTFFVVPFLLFSAVAGQLCDYYDKSKIAQSIKFFELILVCIGSFGFYTHNHYILLGVVGGLGIHSALFGPVKYAILPQHVTSENLLKANAFVEGGTFLAILIGTIFGGLWANNTCLLYTSPSPRDA